MNVLYERMNQDSNKRQTRVGAMEDAINAAREAFHQHLAATTLRQGQQHAQDTSEEDLSQLDERELDNDIGGEAFPLSSPPFSSS